MATPVNALPDPAVITQAALGLVEKSPADWTDIAFVMYYEEPDVYSVRMWTQSPSGGRVRIRPPRVYLQLADMRRAQIEAGSEAWQRCDISLRREPGSQEPDLQVDFAYEVGEIPE